MCHFGGIAVFGEINHHRHCQLQIIKKLSRIPSANEQHMRDSKTCDFIQTENCDAKRLRRICRTGGLFLIWPRGCGGSEGGFSSTGSSAEESWEGLGFGNRRRRFPAGLSRFLQTRGCVKQKSPQRPPPTIRFTDSV